jgi:hypothetical protein
MGFLNSILGRKKKENIIETPSGYIKNGIEFFREGSDFNFLGDSLLFYADNIENQIKYIHANDIKSIKISNAKGSFRNLDFLNEMVMLEGVAILQDKLDLTPLLKLKKLKRLNCHSTTADLDLAVFAELKVLGITHNKFVHHLSGCKNLTWLWIDKLKEENLFCLSPLSQLSTLNLVKSSIADLSGIETLNQLRFLNIDSASELRSLKGLSKNNSALDVLSVYNAPLLNDYKSLENVANLKKLFFGKTGETENLDFMKTLTKLEQVSLGMKVKDGNMTHLENIPTVSFVEYPNYNRKAKDFKHTTHSSNYEKH